MQSIKQPSWILSVCFLALGTLTQIGQPSFSAEVVPLEQQVREVTSRLLGTLDTSAQAKANPQFVSVRMTTCKIQVTDNASRLAGATQSAGATPSAFPPVFLYQEQALSKRLNRPYRQRFMQISPDSDGMSVQSLSFKPAEPDRWIGFCNRPVAERIVPLHIIGEPICSVRLTRSGTTYIGKTPPEGCPANVRGAVKITNTIVLSDVGMDTSDRGFDANGKQVWGAAANEVYQFRRPDFSP